MDAAARACMAEWKMVERQGERAMRHKRRAEKRIHLRRNGKVRRGAGWFGAIVKGVKYAVVAIKMAAKALARAAMKAVKIAFKARTIAKATLKSAAKTMGKNVSKYIGKTATKVLGKIAKAAGKKAKEWAKESIKKRVLGNDVALGDEDLAPGEDSIEVPPSFDEFNEGDGSDGSDAGSETESETGSDDSGSAPGGFDPDAIDSVSGPGFLWKNDGYDWTHGDWTDALDTIGAPNEESMLGVAEQTVENMAAKAEENKGMSDQEIADLAETAFSTAVDFIPVVGPILSPIIDITYELGSLFLDWMGQQPTEEEKRNYEVWKRGQKEKSVQQVLKKLWLTYESSGDMAADQAKATVEYAKNHGGHSLEEMKVFADRNQAWNRQEHARRYLELTKLGFIVDPSLVWSLNQASLEDGDYLAYNLPGGMNAQRALMNMEASMNLALTREQAYKDAQAKAEGDDAKKAVGEEIAKAELDKTAATNTYNTAKEQADRVEALGYTGWVLASDPKKNWSDTLEDEQRKAYIEKVIAAKRSGVPIPPDATDLEMDAAQKRLTILSSYGLEPKTKDIPSAGTATRLVPKEGAMPEGWDESKVYSPAKDDGTPAAYNFYQPYFGESPGKFAGWVAFQKYVIPKLYFSVYDMTGKFRVLRMYVNKKTGDRVVVDGATEDAPGDSATWWYKDSGDVKEWTHGANSKPPADSKLFYALKFSPEKTQPNNTGVLEDKIYKELNISSGDEIVDAVSGVEEAVQDALAEDEAAQERIALEMEDLGITVEERAELLKLREAVKTAQRNVDYYEKAATDKQKEVDDLQREIFDYKGRDNHLTDLITKRNNAYDFVDGAKQSADEARPSVAAAGDAVVKWMEEKRARKEQRDAEEDQKQAEYERLGLTEDDRTEMDRLQEVVKGKGKVVEDIKKKYGDIEQEYLTALDWYRASIKDGSVTDEEVNYMTKVKTQLDELTAAEAELKAAQDALAAWIKGKEDAMKEAAPSDESDTESEEAAPSDESDTESEGAAPEEEAVPSDESDAETVPAEEAVPSDESETEAESVAPSEESETEAESVTPSEESETEAESVAPSDESDTEAESVAPSEESEPEAEITDEDIAEAEKEIEIVPSEVFHPEEAPEEPAPSDESSDDESVVMDEPDAEKTPNDLLDFAQAEKAKGPTEYLNFIQDHGFIPETWNKFVTTQKRSDLEYQEGGPVVADTTPPESYETAQEAIAKVTTTESYETAQEAIAKAQGPAESYETPQEAIAKAMAQQGGASPAKWRKFFGIRKGTGIGSHVPPSLVIRNVWLGNSRDSQDEDFLKAKKIKVVYNCTPDRPEAPGVHTVRFEILDHPDENDKMVRHGLDLAKQIMRESKKHPVLVHCIEGRQRSATIAALILKLQYPKKSLSAIIKALQKKRPIALTPEPTFEPALCALVI